MYQRGIYQPETFTRERKYDLTLLVTTDETLKQYMSEVINQVKGMFIKLLWYADLLYIWARIIKKQHGCPTGPLPEKFLNKTGRFYMYRVATAQGKQGI